MATNLGENFVDVDELAEQVRPLSEPEEIPKDFARVVAHTWLEDCPPNDEDRASECDVEEGDAAVFADESHQDMATSGIIPIFDGSDGDEEVADFHPRPDDEMDRLLNEWTKLPIQQEPLQIKIRADDERMSWECLQLWAFLALLVITVVMGAMTSDTSSSPSLVDANLVGMANSSGSNEALLFRNDTGYGWFQHGNDTNATMSSNESISSVLETGDNFTNATSLALMSQEGNGTIPNNNTLN